MLLRNLLFKVKIFGESCWPELVPGKIYLATSLKKPRIGNYVVFKNPKPEEPEYIIKKVKAAEGDKLTLGGVVSWSSAYIILRSAVIGTIFK